MLEIAANDKTRVILDAAMRVFTQYGYKRTTMADIAEAAGISRPALYLVFRNKTDIYRHGFRDMLSTTFRKVDAVFSSSEPLFDRLRGGIVAGTVEPFRAIASTPHGMELFELKAELAPDIGATMREEMEKRLTNLFADAVHAGELYLANTGATPEALARIIAAAMDGLKSGDCDWQNVESDIPLLLELIVRPLTTVRHS